MIVYVEVKFVKATQLICQLYLNQIIVEIERWRRAHLLTAELPWAAAREMFEWN